MKTRLLICLACCLALFACSDDDGPTAPDTGAIASATIGPDGGSVGNGDISITIQAGALAGDTLLQIFAEDAALGSELGTGVFRLEGLPGGCSLEVSLATTADQGSDHAIQLTTPRSSTVAVAALGDGMLHAGFTPTVGTTTRAAMPVVIHGMAELVDQTIGWDDREVRARVPHDRADAAALLQETLRAVAQGLLAGGFDDHGPDETIGTDVDLAGIDVVVDPRLEAPAVRVLFDAADEFADPQGHDATVVVGHAALSPSNLADTRAQAAMELGALITGLTMRDEQDPDNRLAWLPLAYGRWAAASWASSDLDLPALTDGQIRDLLAGVYHGAAPDLPPAVTSFGPAMSTFLSWATAPEQNGLGFAPALARVSDTGNPTPANLVAAFDEVPASSWWHAFVRDLADGQVLPVSDVAFIDPADGVYAIEEPYDGSHTFTADYRRLSARVFSIRLETAGLSEAAAVRLSLPGTAYPTSHLRLHVFQRLNGQLSHLASGQDLTVGGLDDLHTQGGHLVAIVSCSDHAAPYAEERSVALDVAFRANPDPAPYSGEVCRLAWSGLDEHVRSSGLDCPAGDVLTFDRTITVENGSWNGYSYTGEFDVRSYVDRTHDFGSVIVTMNDLADEVLLIQLEWTHELMLDGTTATDYLNLVWEGGDLAPDPEGAWPLSFVLTGESVSDHINLAHIVAGFDGDCVQRHESLEGSSASMFSVGFAP